MRFLRRIVLTTALALAQTLLVPNAVNAQTFSVIHTFTGGTDGGIPIAGLTIDSAGNLYGTTVGGGMRKPACGGSFGCGVVFKLSQHNGSWVLSTLYQFRAGNDGAGPVSRVIFGPNGRLYGTTEVGGIGCTDNTGCGTVFSLAPPITVCRSIICSWTETVLYRFTGASDGANPLSEVVFDRAGNLYGTTFGGGLVNCYVPPQGCGVVYELSPSQGNWTQTALYRFTGGVDGGNPQSEVVFDNPGNIYGTTLDYGNCCGTVFELTPNGSQWTENTIYSFTGGFDGGAPSAGLTFDQSGNLYGAASSGGDDNGGTAFTLVRDPGGWNYGRLYGAFQNPNGYDLNGPSSTLVYDRSTGNLYGTTWGDGPLNFGSVFRLTQSGGNWTYTSLYDFTGGSDGAHPYGRVVLDSHGNLYGTAEAGGVGGCSGDDFGCGVVYKIALN
jgi:uncharacterized repeat protein (TIGR03803 family)